MYIIVCTNSKLNKILVDNLFNLVFFLESNKDY